jgi:hypothetical protein
VIGDDALAAIEPIANLLDELAVSYHIGGSLASSAHGIPRSTLHAELARARLETLTEEAGVRTVFPLKSPEDLVLRKLLWFRAGGETSERQWGDVVGVIRVQAEKLDWQYLDRWADALELTGLLARARLDAGGT